jgi:branched-chain amino acid transport system ATP-binding protein
MPEVLAPKAPLLVLEDIHAFYGDSHVLQGCSLSVGRECVTVLGRNGMGKTTLLRAIMGLTPPRSGRILMGGDDLVGRKPYEIAAHGIGYVPQGRRLFPSLSVQEHLALTYMKSTRPNEWTPSRVFELFPELADRRRVSGTRLSGGEQQMLAIGRALVTNPKVILLDEPSEGLSPVANERVIETCRALERDGIAILLVEQSIRVAEALAQRIYVLVSGKTVHESPARAFLGDLALRRKFLGV